MKDEKEMKDEELEAATGGKRFARIDSKPAPGGTVVPTRPAEEEDEDDGPTPSIGGVIPLPDPPFHV